MSHETILNNYLARLEKTLGPISVSDKAEIVLEIKSHIEEAVASGTDINEVLNSLGEPEIVANRFLLERGLQTQKAPKHPLIKWLTIGALGTFGIVCLSLIVLVSNFTPLIKVDEKEGHVQILGGLIDIQEKSGKVKVFDTHVEWDEEKKNFKGSLPVKDNKQLAVNFSNARVTLETSVDDTFRWNCNLVESSGAKPNVNNSNDVVLFDLTGVVGAVCEVEVPSNVHTKVRGANGRVVAKEPDFDLDTDIANGVVELALEKTQDYIFEFEVANGQVPSGLVSNKTPKARLMRAKLMNGKIEVSGL